VRWRLGKQISIKLQSCGNPFICKADDISLKGLKIRSARALKWSGDLKMTVALGYELFLNNIEASVVWAKKEGEENIYGLYFTRIKDSDKEAICQFVRDNGLEKLNQDILRKTPS